MLSSSFVSYWQTHYAGGSRKRAWLVRSSRTGKREKEEKKRKVGIPSEDYPSLTSRLVRGFVEGCLCWWKKEKGGRVVASPFSFFVRKGEGVVALTLLESCLEMQGRSRRRLPVPGVRGAPFASKLFRGWS